jgi:hypothetical protein
MQLFSECVRNLPGDPTPLLGTPPLQIFLIAEAYARVGARTR